MSLYQRVNNRINEMGFKSNREFARLSNIPYSSIQLICCGKQTHSKHLDKIAFCLKTTVDFLMSGVVKSKAMTSKPELEEYGFIKEAVPLVPVISWKEAITWRGIVMTQQELKQYEMVPLLSKSSQQSFALKINNDAMLSTFPNTDSFKMGDVIIIDPDKNAKAGQFVVASINNKEPIFRQLVDISGEKSLLALNPIYQPEKVTDEVKIIGVLAGIFRHYS